MRQSFSLQSFIASTPVLTQRDGFKMRWINASPDVAQMVNRQAGRNGANDGLVSKTVRLNKFPFLVLRNGECPITEASDGTFPQPARIRLLDGEPKSLLSRKRNSLMAKKAELIARAAMLIGHRVTSGVTRTAVNAARPHFYFSPMYARQKGALETLQGGSL